MRYQRAGSGIGPVVFAVAVVVVIVVAAWFLFLAPR
jgi:hypothetical protein